MDWHTEWNPSTNFLIESTGFGSEMHPGIFPGLININSISSQRQKKQICISRGSGAIAKDETTESLSVGAIVCRQRRKKRHLLLQICLLLILHFLCLFEYLNKIEIEPNKSNIVSLSYPNNFLYCITDKKHCLAADISYLRCRSEFFLSQGLF